MKVKCVTITDEQENFLIEQRKPFNLSKFLQSKLGEYIKAMTEYREFITK